MPDDISLLPEEMRKKEDLMKKGPQKETPAPSELKFSTPVEEGEDVEVIEIDEGEVDQVLAGESPVARAIYRVTNFFDDLKSKLLQPHEAEPPPKLPPQFFTPPPVKPKPVAPPQPPAPSAIVTQTPAAAPPKAAVVAPAVPAAAPKIKPRIVPSDKTPRRVRVIRRVRKPVRVSFVSEEDLKLLHIDVSKRKFTFIILTVMFTVVIGGGASVLKIQQGKAGTELSSARQQTSQMEAAISAKQKEWTDFQNLEPKLKSLIGLLDKHLSPTGLLQLIESHTLPSVYYNSFSYTPDHKVMLGVMADSYESAAKQVVAFQRLPQVTNVESSGFNAKYTADNALTPESVQFQLTLTLSDAALITPPLADQAQ